MQDFIYNIAKTFFFLQKFYDRCKEIDRSLHLVMSTFNRFFDDQLNRLSKNQFFFDVLKFNFDLWITLKSKNRFLTPLLPY